MRPHLRLAITAAALVAALAGCTDTDPSPGGHPTSNSSPGPSYGPHVVHFDGVPGIGFGDLRESLVAAGRLATGEDACGPTLSATPEVQPVFDGEKLVLLWADPPYRTPEGVGVGSPVTDVRRAYPEAERLTPPAGSHTFPGLLVTHNDRAYLFLHDDETVQKLIVGYTEYARRLFEHGFGEC
jgi:hypothetical protein